MLFGLENNRAPWPAYAWLRVMMALTWFGLVGGFTYAGPVGVSPVAAAETSRALTVVVLGDSLTAGYGLPADHSFPAQLERALKARGHAIQLVNAGVSGDTTAAGLLRLDWAVPDGTDGVVLELGANDALRGMPPAAAQKNLAAILERLKARNIPVLIAGMRAPGNWGKAYAAAFDRIFPDLARRYGHELYPFFLEGVAVDKRLNQSDGMHPNAAGVAEIVKRFLPSMERFIGRLRRGGGKS